MMLISPVCASIPHPEDAAQDHYLHPSTSPATGFIALSTVSAARCSQHRGYRGEEHCSSVLSHAYYKD